VTISVWVGAVVRCLFRCILYVVVAFGLLVCSFGFATFVWLPLRFAVTFTAFLVIFYILPGSGCHRLPLPSVSGISGCLDALRYHVLPRLLSGLRLVPLLRYVVTRGAVLPGSWIVVVPAVVCSVLPRLRADSALCILLLPLLFLHSVDLLHCCCATIHVRAFRLRYALRVHYVYVVLAPSFRSCRFFVCVWVRFAVCAWFWSWRSAALRLRFRSFTVTPGFLPGCALPLYVIRLFVAFRLLRLRSPLLRRACLPRVAAHFLRFRWRALFCSFCVYVLVSQFATGWSRYVLRSALSFRYVLPFLRCCSYVVAAFLFCGLRGFWRYVRYYLPFVPFVPSAVRSLITLRSALPLSLRCRCCHLALLGYGSALPFVVVCCVTLLSAFRIVRWVPVTLRVRTFAILRCSVALFFVTVRYCPVAVGYRCYWIRCALLISFVPSWYMIVSFLRCYILYRCLITCSCLVRTVDSAVFVPCVLRPVFIVDCCCSHRLLLLFTLPLLLPTFLLLLYHHDCDFFVTFDCVVWVISSFCCSVIVLLLEFHCDFYGIFVY